MLDIDIIDINEITQAIHQKYGIEPTKEDINLVFGLSQRHNKATIQSIVASLTRKDTKTNAIIVKGYGVLHCQAYFASESDAIDLINKHHGTSFSSFSEACDSGVDDSFYAEWDIEGASWLTDK